MVGATDFETGEEIVYDFDDLNKDEYVDAVLASASVPVLFPPTKLKGRVLIDSLSTGWNVNMISAI
jgi:predicted acylesterase/phospholipase RssA